MCKGHSSAIKHLDFSVSSRMQQVNGDEEDASSEEGLDDIILQSNDAIKEILFWDVHSGKQMTNISKIRDAKWHTWSCTVGWPVQGIFNGPGGQQYSGSRQESDVHAASKSGNTMSTELLVAVGTMNTHGTGDNSSKVKKEGGRGNISNNNNENISINHNVIKLFRYPCLPSAAPVLYNYGHTGNIADVQFGNCDKNVITAGGNDSCILQFTCKRSNKVYGKNKM